MTDQAMMHVCVDMRRKQICPVYNAESDKRRDQRDYGVRLCSNTECIRTMWDRDVNAAINMLTLLTAWVRREAKPAPFQRHGALDDG